MEHRAERTAGDKFGQMVRGQIIERCGFMERP